MKSTKREEILAVATKLTQARGLNGFSYSDIADEIGIKTSSIHYYFKTKDDLIIALIKRYHESFKTQLSFIDAKASTPNEKLLSFSSIFTDLAGKKDTFCLCGMMATELTHLSEQSHRELTRYFQFCTAWLSHLFVQRGSKQPEIDAKAYLSPSRCRMVALRSASSDSSCVTRAGACPAS